MSEEELLESGFYVVSSRGEQHLDAEQVAAEIVAYREWLIAFAVASTPPALEIDGPDLIGCGDSQNLAAAMDDSHTACWRPNPWLASSSQDPLDGLYAGGLCQAAIDE
jgi:hypothetical protein